MKVTVAICTWNRAALLDKTLSAMRQLQIPAGAEWELLIVNNRCEDDTDDVIEKHASELPLRRLFEPELGQSRARNTALDAAAGDLILWTDDDVIVDPRWLAEYCAAAERWPTASYFGGRILPWYECPPPSWVENNLSFLKGVLLVRDLGPEERPFRGGEEPSGASMMFRRSVFNSWRFEPRLGLVGQSPVRGEDTQLIDTLRNQGEVGVYAPLAVVQHFVPASRMTRQYLWQWAYGWGRGSVRRAKFSDRANARSKSRLKLRIQQLRCAAHYLSAQLRQHDSWPKHYHNLAMAAGMLAELRDHDGNGAVVA
jgi:glycosyltransferase involved in cell wall biosynthesis